MILYFPAHEERSKTLDERRRNISFELEEVVFSKDSTEPSVRLV